MSGGGDIEEEEGHGGSNVFGEQSTPAVSLNLTALMDILSNLLFFLLAAFGATIVMSINATVPVQSGEQSDISEKKQSVTVNIALQKSGYSIGLLGTAQTPEELEKWSKRIPAASEGPDYPELGKVLLAIKEQYPKSETVILTPEAGTSYLWMIRTMDTAREREVVVAGKRMPITLFPNVVVSTVIQ